MQLRMSSIPLMLNYVSSLSSDLGDRAAVARVLAHEDYQFELRRYGIPSPEGLVDYFSRLAVIAPEEIPDLSPNHRKNALREKHGDWLDCAKNPEKYTLRAQQLQNMFTGDFLADMQQRLADMFPQGTEVIPDPALVSTLSFGRSFGYPFEGAVHLDLFGIKTVCSLEMLPCVMLHEMHHLQMQKLMESAGLLSGGYSLLDRYILQFAAEGLAVKCCNNAEGVLSKRLDPALAPNLCLPALPALNRHFPEHFRLFCDTVGSIRAGTFTEQDMVRQREDYWLNPCLHAGAPLGQTLMYSLGNDLYGCIYDAFGLEAVFECVLHPAQLIDAFNRAGCGYSIPETG